MKTQRDRQEGNRLIAEFMDYEHDNYEGDINSITYHCEEYLINVSGLDPWNTTADDWESWLRPDEMEFHSSWDWLMPVIEKINLLGYEVLIGRISCQVNEIADRKKTISSMVCGDVTRKIDITYSAIVQFIKWYNDNKE